MSVGNSPSSQSIPTDDQNSNHNNNNNINNNNNSNHDNSTDDNVNNNPTNEDTQNINHLSTSSTNIHNWALPFLEDSNSSDYLYNINLSNIPHGDEHELHFNHDKTGQSQSIPQRHTTLNHIPTPTYPQPSFNHHSPLQHSPLSHPTNPSMQHQPMQNPSQTKQKQKRPCDQCRRRKTKCVLVPNTNNCIQCETKQLSCTYTSQALKRKPVEFENVNNFKKNKHDYSSHILTNESIQVPNVPIRDVQPIQDYSSINNSLLKKTLSLQFPRSSFYVGPTSYLYDINLLNLIIEYQNKNQATNKIEQVSLSDSISLRKVGERTQFVLKDDQSPQSYQTMSNDVDAIEKFVSPHGQILIDLYFRIIHPSYPILHKKVFLEKYSRTHREFSAPLLAAVYVLAIQWWDYDPQLNRFPKPNVDLILKIGLNNYLLEILKRPKLSAVQAGLLLLQRKHIANFKTVNGQIQRLVPGDGGDAEYSDWVLCSQVVSLAEELGLGLDCNNWKLPKWERGLRKRLAWAVYMEDKWLSLKDSRPSHINEMNWVVQPLQQEDFPEKHGDGDLKEGSSDIDNGKLIFTNLIELSKILSDILNQFYSMRAMMEIIEVNQVLKIAKPLQLRLRNWFHSLPVELQMSSVQPRKLCSNGYLQLAYFATELTLHRKIITIIYHQSKLGKPPPIELINVCRAAAKTRLMASIEFVRDLKPEHIHSFWHSSSSSNFTLIGTFAAILFMSSPTKEEIDFYRDQIFNYRWILKISSKGFDQVAEALLQLDLVLANVPGLLNDNVDLPMVTPIVQDSTNSTNTPQRKSPYSPFYQQVNNNNNNLPPISEISPREKNQHSAINSPNK